MKFLIKTLGCKVNAYESAVISNILTDAGYKEVKDNADIVIVNTCTVTNTADNKSLKTVRQASRENKDAIIIVMGCYSQADASVLASMDEVDIILGNNNKSKIIEYIEDFKQDKNKQNHVSNIEDVKFEDMILKRFDHARAFVKIEDGCDNYCTYCIIPYVRGHVRSKNRDTVINEIEELVEKNYKEIVLTGIHTGHYGADLNNYSFSNLLNDICKIKNLQNLRISSIEITELTDEFMNVLKDNKIIVDHLHIPLQSGSDKILKLMNRKYDKEYFINKIKEIRNIRPEISITTDLIVGFPDEEDIDFEETINTIEKIGFSKIHVFPFSKRKGTVAANMSNQISEVIKKERVRKIVDLSKELEIKYMTKFIGRTLEFIPETKNGDYTFGHTGNYLHIKSNKDTNEITINKIEYPHCLD